MQKITINLWFNNEAEEAANFYTSLFPNSRITTTTRYPDAGQEITGQTAGSILTVAYELDGQSFVALNGGKTDFSFNDAISLIVNCDTQEEIDKYWEALTADGGEEVQCGWLKDKYGVSWQITPPLLDELLASAEPGVPERVMEAMLPMKKLDIAALQAAADKTA